MNIWQICKAENYIAPLTCQAWRVVENQMQSTTRPLVDSVAEHDLLEELLEQTKPLQLLTEIEYHYLLKTPFRYPPLKYGSRFGTEDKRGIWHGSFAVKTALTEVGYYRMRFLKDTEAKIDFLFLTFTAFSVNIKSEHGLDLSQAPFNNYKDKISDPTTYQYSQHLGNCMREHGVNVFYYFSARDVDSSLNVGVFSPIAFASKKPNSDQQTWNCFCTKEKVEFLNSSIFESTKYEFHAEQFNY